MQSRNVALAVITLLFAGCLLGAQSAQTPNAKPVSQEGLIKALQIGGLTTQELIEIVERRGVAFQVTAQVEADLRAAGATTPLINAVRANYRPATDASTTARLGPLSKNEIITLLQAGTPQPRIGEFVKERGVNFTLTPAISGELASAGAGQELLETIKIEGGKTGGTTPTPKRAADVPRTTPAEPTHDTQRTGTRLTSIKDVHKLYIEKMENKLDEYLRAELSKQLPGRFVVVLNKEEADAVMTGTGEKKTGTGATITGRYLGLHDTATGTISIIDRAGTVLWASEAGDRSLLLGPIKRGGTRKVADRLVHNLKKALEEGQ